MKRLLLLIVAILLAAPIMPCYAQRAAAPERIGLIDTDYDYALYGNVSSVKQSVYELVDKFGTETKGSYIGSSTIKFTTRGHVSNATIYFGEGQSEICTYIYDQNGRITSVNHVDEYDGSNAGKTVFKYGSNGKWSQRGRYWPNGSLMSKTVYSYDSANRLSAEIEYDSDGTILSKSVYSYGSNGKVSQMLVYDSRGKLIFKKKYTYDSYKNLISFTTYNANGGKEYEETYKYNSNGYMTSSTEQDFMYGYKNTYKYKYDSRGNIIERRIYDGDALIPSQLITYTIAYR